MRPIRLKQSICQTYRSLFKLPFQVRYGNISAKSSSGSSSSDLLTTQATTTETEALPENPNSSETKENSQEDGESGGIDVPSPLEEIGDTFGLAISTLSSALLLIFNNAPEGRFEGLLYFISLALIFQCIHYIYNQFFTFLFKILNKGMARTNVDEKKLSNKE